MTRTIKATFTDADGVILDTAELEIEDPNISELIICGVPAGIETASPRSQLDSVSIGKGTYGPEDCKGHCDDLSGPAGITTYCDGSCRS